MTAGGVAGIVALLVGLPAAYAVALGFPKFPLRDSRLGSRKRSCGSHEC